MKLYILISNNGDGSSSVQFTLDYSVIEKMEKDYDESNPEFDYERWADGDGFHYKTINVPDDSTYESLGIRYPLESD